MKKSILKFALLLVCFATFISCRDTASSDDNPRVENDESTIGTGAPGNNTGSNVDANRPDTTQVHSHKE